MAGVYRLIEVVHQTEYAFGYKIVEEETTYTRATRTITKTVAETTALTEAEALALDPQVGFTVAARRRANKADWWTVIEEKEVEGSWSFEAWPTS